MIPELSAVSLDIFCIAFPRDMWEEDYEEKRHYGIVLLASVKASNFNAHNSYYNYVRLVTRLPFYNFKFMQLYVLLLHHYALFNVAFLLFYNFIVLLCYRYAT